MKGPINTERLERLFNEMEPEEIRVLHGDQLDDEARQLFEQYQKVADGLDSLAQDYSALAPAVPEVSSGARVVSISRWRRGVTLPTWALPLAAAAMLCLGFLVPRPQQPMEVEQLPQSQETLPFTDDLSLEQLLDRVRSVKIEREINEFDRKIADGYLARALHYYDQSDEDGYRKALLDLEKAHQLNPKNKSILEYMAICSDSLGHKLGAEQFEKLAEEL